MTAVAAAQTTLLPALAASGVVVAFHGTRVLDDVGVAVHAGELVVLVGPNGAGKSTLLSVLAGDVEPDAGTVSLGGTPMATLRAAERARRRAVLLQHNDVTFPFRVVDVVAMGRAPWSRQSSALEDDAAIDEAMQAAEIIGFAERTVTALSGGERARVAFARTHAQRCAVLLLDEPTASLDIRHQERVLRSARDHADDGGAAIVVLHDLNLAAAYADRIALLERGRLVSCGTPEEVLDAAVLSEVYRHPVHVERSRSGSLLVVPERAAATRERGGPSIRGGKQ